MDTGQYPTDSQGQPQPAAAPAYTPPPMPAYQPPPRPPRKPMATFLKVIFTLFAFVVFLVFGFILFVAVVLRGDRDKVGFGDRIGLVKIENAIMQGDECRFWIDSIREFAEDSHIRGIIVRIDSPGGTVGASQEVFQAVLDARKKKSVYVSMGDVAASGGYYIASAAERIYANRGTMTGSIGVIYSKPDVSVLTERLGIGTENIKSGKFKDSGSITRRLSPEEQAMFQTLIDDTYLQFLTDVHRQRERAIGRALTKFSGEAWDKYGFVRPVEETTKTLSMAFLRQVADGRVYTGEQALQLGLIDQIGSLEQVIRDIGAAKKIQGRPKIQEAKKKRSLFEMLESRVGDILPASHSPLHYRMP